MSLSTNSSLESEWFLLSLFTKSNSLLSSAHGIFGLDVMSPKYHDHDVNFTELLNRVTVVADDPFAPGAANEPAEDVNFNAEVSVFMIVSVM